MNKIPSKRCCAATLLILLMLLMQGIPQFNVAGQGSETEHLAVILILDNSGSMESNDPTNLRYTAAQLFISLLDEGDAVGAIRFSTTATPLTDGVEVITSPEVKTGLVQNLAPFSSENFTDVKAAFEEALDMKDAFIQNGYQVVVIFLTDGIPEIPKPYATYEQETLQTAAKLNVPILSIALTRSGRSQFLTQLTSETGGQLHLANSASDLLDIFLQILGQLKDRTAIGSGSINAPGTGVLPLDEALLPYIDQVSFVVSKPASAIVQLVSPGGEIVPADDPSVNFSIRDPRFEVYTLKQPASGDWHFEIKGSGMVQVRAILYSHLRVRLVSPGSFFETDQPILITVKLVEEQTGQEPITIIGEASFTALITHPDGSQDSLDRFYDDGTHGDELAGDGLFTRSYVNTDQPGMYQLTIQGYKGAVPVAYQTQLNGIAFPLPIIDKPDMNAYDIRAENILIQIHLAGAEVNDLDAGGFDVLITTPGGNIERVRMTYAGEVYSAGYLPKENGIYTLLFEPVDAYYLGMPYVHTVEISFTARLIPTLKVESVQIGLSTPEKGVPARFELAEAQEGIPLLVTFSSSSTKTESVTAHLEEMPGFMLVESGEQSVSPTGKTTLTLHLLGDSALRPGSFDGKLVFSSSEGVDLIGGELPLELEIFTPTLTIVPSVTVGKPSPCCWSPVPVTLILQLTSTSNQSEKIHLALEDLEGATINPETVTVPSGSSQIEFTVLPDGKAFPSGEYAAVLVVSGVRMGLEFVSGTNYPLAFKIEPVWATCLKTMIILVVITGILIIIIRRLFKGPEKPFVAGTLVHWNEATPDQKSSEYLTDRKKMEITVGKGENNDVYIPDDSLEDAHIVIVAKRTEENNIEIFLRPKGIVQKGYLKYTSEFQLDDAEYKMGNRKFTFIPDL